MSVLSKYWLSLSLVLVGGCGASTVDPTDTNTSWLRSCNEDADCGGNFSCLCGVCTIACDGDSACDNVSPDAVCRGVEDSCGDAQRTCQRDNTTDRAPAPSGHGQDAGQLGDSAEDASVPLTTEAPLTSDSTRLASPDAGGATNDASPGPDSTSSEASVGTECGAIRCAWGDVCCDDVAGVCAADLSQCPAIGEPLAECMSFEQVADEVFVRSQGHVFDVGILEITQTFRGETKSTDAYSEGFSNNGALFSRYGLPANAVMALGYFGAWSAYSAPLEYYPLDPLYEAEGVGTAWAYNMGEADGAANELTFSNSCLSATATDVTWTYQVKLALADLIDYELYAYLDSDAPVVTLEAVEHYQYGAGTGPMAVYAVATGLIDGEPVEISVVGSMIRTDLDPE